MGSRISGISTTSFVTVPSLDLLCLLPIGSPFPFSFLNAISLFLLLLIGDFFWVLRVPISLAQHKFRFLF